MHFPSHEVCTVTVQRIRQYNGLFHRHKHARQTDRQTSAQSIYQKKILSNVIVDAFAISTACCDPGH